MVSLSTVADRRSVAAIGTGWSRPSPWQGWRHPRDVPSPITRSRWSDTRDAVVSSRTDSPGEQVPAHRSPDRRAGDRGVARVRVLLGLSEGRVSGVPSVCRLTTCRGRHLRPTAVVRCRRRRSRRGVAGQRTSVPSRPGLSTVGPRTSVTMRHVVVAAGPSPPAPLAVGRCRGAARPRKILVESIPGAGPFLRRGRSSQRSRKGPHRVPDRDPGPRSGLSETTDHRVARLDGPGVLHLHARRVALPQSPGWRRRATWVVPGTVVGASPCSSPHHAGRTGS